MDRAKAAGGEPHTSNFNWADNGLDPDRKGKKLAGEFVIADQPEPGGLMVSVDGGPPRPVTGDIDLVAITKADGTPLSQAVHARILNILSGPPMYLQHPETSTWIKDGVFDFATNTPSTEDLPIQFAPDGLGAWSSTYAPRQVVLPVEALRRAASATWTG